MEGIVNVENLWIFIDSLSLSKENKRWLAGKLCDGDSVGISDSKADSFCPYSKEQLDKRFSLIERDIENGVLVDSEEVDRRMDDMF